MIGGLALVSVSTLLSATPDRQTRLPERAAPAAAPVASDAIASGATQSTSRGSRVSTGRKPAVALAAAHAAATPPA